MVQDNAVVSEGVSLKRLWIRSKDKISGNKEGEPVLNKASSDEHSPESVAGKEMDKRQHRRAQVRKAQIEHRQRKDNHVKELEQEAVRLREAIAKVEAEGSALHKENWSLVNLLSTAGITTSLGINVDVGHTHISPSSQSFNQVDIKYDPSVDARCLRISRSNSSAASWFDQQISSGAGTSTLGVPSTPGTIGPSESIDSDQHYAPIITLDESDVAVNFILALEHPCRKHFHHTSPRTGPFDPDIPETGHALMASTLLYLAAPDSAFDSSSKPSCSAKPDPKSDSSFEITTSWLAPSLELSKLYEMALSLPKEDFEVTPVQSWFMLVEAYGTEKVLANIERLKAGLAPLVLCNDYGAFVNRWLFWETAAEILDYSS